MKNKSQNVLFSVSIFAVFALLFCSSVALQDFNLYTSDNNEIPIEYMQASYSINPADPSELVGDADYVFVGKVDKIAGTTYKHHIAFEDEKGNKIEVTDPYTDYYITVYDNIKGELILNNSIPIQKAGGISQDKKSYTLYEDDFLLEEGEVYIFYAYAQFIDGSLLVSGANSTVAFKSLKSSANSSEIFKQTDEYSIVIDAFKNQKEIERKRATATYDVVNQ